jgi:thymidylate kinase
VIVLDAPGDALHDRKGEHDPDRLEAMRAAYRRIAEGRKNAVVLDATAEPDAVRRAATAAIWDRWARRGGR